MKYNKSSNKFVYPNVLDTRNAVSVPNLVWCAYTTKLFTKLKDKPNTSFYLFLVIDLATSKILTYKLQAKILSNDVIQALEPIVSTLRTHIDHKIIIHTDQGTEFTSKEYNQFITKYQDIIEPSMSHKNVLQHNGVIERFMRTFEYQKKRLHSIPLIVDSFEQLKQDIQMRISDFNSKALLKRSHKVTPNNLKKALIQTKENLPLVPISHNFVDKGIQDHNEQLILKYKQQAILEWKDESIDQILDNTKVLREEMEVTRQQLNWIGHTVHTIKEIVEKKPKKIRLSQPLRQPASNSIYFALMEQEREPHEKRLQFARFRVAITLLWATGLRANEIRSITYEDIQSIIDHQVIQVHQPKTNKFRVIHFAQETVKPFLQLKKDLHYLYKLRGNNTLAGDILESNWIKFLNERLRERTKHLKLNIKSHSFRVNFVTSLLKHAPIQTVAHIIGHSNINTTLRYDRYYQDPQKTKELISKAFEDTNT